jgi:putative tricarboxylic transport membrane protein
MARETAAAGEQFPGGRRLALGELAIAAAVLLLAGLVYWQSGQIPVSPIFAKVGPTVVPYLTSAAFAALGVFLLVSALRGGWQSDEEKQSAPDRVGLAWVVGGLALNVLLIAPLGFTLSSTLMFACIARGFGSRNLARDAGIGVIFALIAYFGFAKALGINIGAGVVESTIDSLFLAR